MNSIHNASAQTNVDNRLDAASTGPAAPEKTLSQRIYNFFFGSTVTKVDPQKTQANADTRRTWSQYLGIKFSLASFANWSLFKSADSSKPAAQTASHAIATDSHAIATDRHAGSNAELQEKSEQLDGDDSADGSQSTTKNVSLGDSSVKASNGSTEEEIQSAVMIQSAVRGIQTRAAQEARAPKALQEVFSRSKVVAKEDTNDAVYAGLAKAAKIAHQPEVGAGDRLAKLLSKSPKAEAADNAIWAKETARIDAAVQKQESKKDAEFVIVD